MMQEAGVRKDLEDLGSCWVLWGGFTEAEVGLDVLLNLSGGRSNEAKAVTERQEGQAGTAPNLCEVSSDSHTSSMTPPRALQGRVVSMFFYLNRQRLAQPGD